MHGPLNRGQGHLQGLLQQCHQTSPQVNHEMLTPTFFLPYSCHWSNSSPWPSSQCKAENRS